MSEPTDENTVEAPDNTDTPDDEGDTAGTPPEGSTGDEEGGAEDSTTQPDD